MLFRSQNIKRVVGRFSPRTLAYPGANWSGPFTRFTQAQNSSQFCIAVGLVGKDVTAVETFTKGFADPEVMEFIKKVEVVEYPELGMEAIWKIEVEDFPAFVVVDDKGNDFFASVGAHD